MVIMRKTLLTIAFIIWALLSVCLIFVWLLLGMAGITRPALWWVAIGKTIREQLFL